MNNRVKELIESLGIVPEDEHYQIVKLVIRECIRQAHGVADLRGVNEDMVYGADTAALRIHRHFGDEE